VDGPRSITEYNTKIDGLEAGGSARGLATDDPLRIHADGLDLLAPTSEDGQVVEIAEGSKHSVIQIARAMVSHPQPGVNPLIDAALNRLAGSSGNSKAGGAKLAAAAGEKSRPCVGEKGRGKSFGEVAGHGQPGSSAEGLSAGGVPHGKERLRGLKTEDSAGCSGVDASVGSPGRGLDGEGSGSGGEEHAGVGARKVCNATARRRGAFRRGLVRCVMLVQDDFIKTAEQKGGHDMGGGYDALKEGSWHPGFWAAVPDQEAIMAAATRAAAELSLAEKTGNIR
jgi:hypothetical protein